MATRDNVPLPNHDNYELWSHAQKLSYVAFLTVLLGSRQRAVETWCGLVLDRLRHLAEA